MNIVGVDIGGANLKVARSDGAAWSEPFALWQQPQVLASQLVEQWFAQTPEVVLATMTGELCDCYTSRAEGVCHILEQLEAAAGDAALYVWSMAEGFVTADRARHAPRDVASGNWHALASWLAPMWSAGLTLLLDVGSTTSDLIAMRDGRVTTDSRTDLDRLTRGELVYAGARRTPIMALTQTLQLNGITHPVVAEHFATMRDALVVTGDLPEAAEDTDTPDGRAVTKPDAARRLLRVIGSDFDHHSETEARSLAEQCRDCLETRLTTAMQQVLNEQTPDRIVLSGSGAVVGARAAARLHPDVPRVTLAERIGEPASDAACAHALVQIWQRDHA